MTSRSASILTVLLALVPARPLLAQASACPYERCALRLQASLFSERIVQGASATPVARLGLFAPSIPPLAAAGDSARAHYQTFQTLQNRGGAFSVAAGAAAVAVTVILASHTRSGDNPPTVTWWIAGAGIGFGLVGGIHARLAREQLYRAMWFYNGSLRTGT
jgi:hypothetical protein